MYYIYRIRNKIHHKSYIGLTSNYNRRIKSHQWCLENRAHSCKEMQNDYSVISARNKNRVVYEILAQCEDKELAQDLEYLFIYREIAHKKSVYNKNQLNFPTSLPEKNSEYANQFIDNRTLLCAYFNREFGDVAFKKFCKILGREYLIDLLEIK